MNDTLKDLMREATQLTQAGRLKEATAVIQRMLSATAPAEPPLKPFASAPFASPAPNHADTSPQVLDGCVFEAPRPSPTDEWQLKQSPAPASKITGEFISGTHTQASLTRRYKLYVPPGHDGQQRPLVVMLHGCTQNPDDFAAGTGMNERA